MHEKDIAITQRTPMSISFLCTDDWPDQLLFLSVATSNQAATMQYQQEANRFRRGCHLCRIVLQLEVHNKSQGWLGKLRSNGVGRETQWPYEEPAELGSSYSLKVGEASIFLP